MDTAETITLAWSPGELSAQVSRFEPSVEPSAPAELVVPQRLGTVRLVRELGRGGMGLVWLGHHEFLDRPVAVKFLLRASVEREDPRYQAFLDGARAASNVRHLAMSSVLHADLINGVPYIVMEYISGPTVAEIIDRTGPLRPAAVLAMLERIADAVAALHDAGVVHRDIKPSNILVDAAGNSFLTDFGLAIRAGAESPFGACGTPVYMAPEVFEGQSSTRTDVYALAVTAYHALIGRAPVSGTIAEMRQRHRQGVIDPSLLRPLGIPTALAEVLGRAAAPEAAHRTRNARKFLEGFREALGAASGPGSGGAGGGIDQLARLVEQITSGRAPEALPGRPGTPASATGPLVPSSVPCERCGYDLDGVPIAGECPECRAPVERSLRPHRLVFADRDWLERTHHGLVWLSAAMGVLFVVGATTLNLPALEEATGQFIPVTFSLAALVAAGAYLVAARAEPAGDRPAGLALRPAARWAAMGAAIVAGMGLGSSLMWAFSRGGLSLMPAWPGLVSFAALGVGALILVPTWAWRVLGGSGLGRAPELGANGVARLAVALFTIACAFGLAAGLIGPIAALTFEQPAGPAMRSGAWLAFVVAAPLGSLALALTARAWKRVLPRAVRRPAVPDRPPRAAEPRSSYYDRLRTFASRRRGGDSGAETPGGSPPG